MAKYRKKPVVIDAFQWTGGPDQTEDPAWITGAILHGDVGFDRDRKSLWIRTLEGTMTAFVGDWIIRGVMGEIYPCKPDIFAANYEPVEEPPHATT